MLILEHVSFYLAGDDPAKFMPMLQSDGTLRRFPKQLLWVYSIRTRDKQVVIQPSALVNLAQETDPQQVTASQTSSSSSPEPEYDKEINNNDVSVPSLVSQSASSSTPSQRKAKICTICFKVSSFYTYLKCVGGIVLPQLKIHSSIV